MRADAPTSRLRQAHGVVVGGVGANGGERGLVHQLHDGRDQPVTADRGDGRRTGGHVREKAPTVEMSYDAGSGAHHRPCCARCAWRVPRPAHGLHVRRAAGAHHGPRVGGRTVPRAAGAGGLERGAGGVHGVAEFHAQAGDDAVARVAGVPAEAFLTDPYTVSFLPRSRRRERLADMFDRVIRDILRPDPARGVARALVKRPQRDARQAGVGVCLESSARAKVRLYERLGFRETGPGAWPPRGYPRSGSDIMDLGSH